MRFLCLHGRGTNSDIFETQLSMEQGQALLWPVLQRLHSFFRPPQVVTEG
jgi:hypothetical protein